MTPTPTAAARVSGTIKAAQIAHQIADGLEEAGQSRPNGDVLHDVVARILTAIQPDPEPETVSQAAMQPDRNISPICQPEPQPVAWASFYTSGKIASVVLRPDYYRSTPLYATPSSAGMVSVEEAGALEGTTNWLDALLTLIDETSCDPDDEERFDETIMGARLALASGRSALRALAGEGGR